jgi:predicted DNA-binding transcriptional regulator YafY
MHPLERLIDLVALLLNARRPLTFDEIRGLIPAYQQDDHAAAKRMFERDKDVLKDVGIPVELAATDVWDVEQGYRIPKDRYYLPDAGFTTDEVWALFVAAHAPEESGEAEHAFLKLTASTDPNVLSAIAERAAAPGVDASGPYLGAIADAISRRRSIRFRYRPSQGRPGERHLDPYSLVFRGGNWYVVGLDRVRGEIRSFRLSRMTSGMKEAGEASAAPEGFNASLHLTAGPWGLGAPEQRATIAFSPDVAWMAIGSTPGANIVRSRPDGWVETEVPAGPTDAFVSWVLSFGSDAEVVAPRQIRHEVVERLSALAGAPA